MKNKKKMNCGTISGLELHKQTRGRQIPTFRSGVYQTVKDKPRDKNWKKWV